MSGATYFVQECPTCGRRLEVRVEFLGKLVKCQHCHGKFAATDLSNEAAVPTCDNTILSRADELLAASVETPKRPR